MKEWREVYEVIKAMVPIYVALALGYGSVKWWRIFTPDQCAAVNQFVTYFTLPLFTFEFIAHIDPFKMNFRFIAADVISKVIIIGVLVIWVMCRGRSASNYDWCITSFSLSTMSNTLVVGVPLLRSMYGAMAQDLVIQSFVLQGIIWLTLLLIVMEVRKALICDMMVEPSYKTDGEEQPQVIIVSNKSEDQVSELKGTEQNVSNVEKENRPMSRPSFGSFMKSVILKLAYNPNSYSSIVGLVWAAISHGLHIKMPEIIEGSVLILSNAGAGTIMFSLGLFMALQEKFVACGPKLTFWGILLRFIMGPAAMAIASFAVGLRGTVFRVAVIQAALPQSVICFVYARDYNLHPEVLSTVVIFGTFGALPVLIGYYTVLEK